MDQVREIPHELIFGNPAQPRKHFDAAELEDLAAAIRERGQKQPCRVTPRGGRFMLIMGERRWRAQGLNGAATVPCIVDEDVSDTDVLIDAIVENRQRADVTPLEEASAFQAALDTGISEQSLAEKLGLQQAWRIRERTCLLKLRPEYQQLLAKGQLGGSQGFEMAQLSPAGQDRLFAAIRKGECPTYAMLRSVALVLRDEEAQAGLDWGEEPPPPTANEKMLAKGLERRVQQVAAMLRAAIIENEVVAAKKVNPDKARSTADLLAAMQIDLKRIEESLR